MNYDDLKDYRNNLESVLKTLLKAHKDLQYVLTTIPGLDLDVRGVHLADPKDFTMLVEKSLGEIVSTGKQLNGHRENVLRILTEAENARDAGDSVEESKNLTELINKTVR